MQYACIQSTITFHTLKYCAVIKHHDKTSRIFSSAKCHYAQNPQWGFWKVGMYGCCRPNDENVGHSNE